MTAPILNLADAVLQSRPPEYLPPAAAAQRIDARLGRAGALPGLHKLACGLVVVASGAEPLPFRFVGRASQQVDGWDGNWLAGRPTHAAR